VSSPQGPLADLRIVALEQYGAGPFATLHLADLGADVIKIEDPHSGGDIGRYVPPFQEGSDSLFFETYNRNKRSLALDVRTDAGQRVLHDLVRMSDVVFSNLRGDVPAKLGITYAQLAPVNPKIVCCSLTGFGMTGPRAAQPAYDYLLQGLAGWMHLTGDPEGPPTKSGLSLVDFTAGYVATAAILAGVHAARRTGIGMDCDTSLFDVATTMLGYVATWNLNGGPEPTRTRHSAHPSLVPFENFPTADGWIVVACAKEKFWQRLATALGRPDLLTHPDYADFAQRRLHHESLTEELTAILRTAPTEKWINELSAAGVPCARINTVSEALNDPQTVARDLIVHTEHPRFGTVRSPASPVRVGDNRQRSACAPAMNADAEHILGNLLGYTPAQRTELEAAGAFGPDLPPDRTSQ
jgi:crotonobetainyl-CoA:carnitine CoA-transferase CaiB-like acyl-CoA transferase